MKRKLMTIIAGCMALSVCAQENLHHGYPITPVPFTSVKVNDTFWGQRLKASREVTIPLAFSKCEETGRYKNFEIHQPCIGLMTVHGVVAVFRRPGKYIIKIITEPGYL